MINDLMLRIDDQQPKECVACEVASNGAVDKRVQAKDVSARMFSLQVLAFLVRGVDIWDTSESGLWEIGFWWSGS